MSQLLFPPQEEVPSTIVSQDNIDGPNMGPTEPITQDDRIMRLIISGAIGCLLGVVEAVIISNSLVEIATTKGFSIAFGIVLLILAVVLGWRIWVSHQGGNISRIVLLLATLFVAIAAILCFAVDSKAVVAKTPGAKTPFFMFIAMALAFALTFAFSEFINLGICDLCCPRTFSIHPAFISRVQIYFALGAGLALGFFLGIMFGTMDVEDDVSASHTRLVKMLLLGLIPGIFIGGPIGLFIEWVRDRVPSGTYDRLPSAPEAGRALETRSDHGYDDI